MLGGGFEEHKGPAKIPRANFDTNFETWGYPLRYSRHYMLGSSVEVGRGARGGLAECLVISA